MFTLETLRSLGLRNFFEKIEEHVSTCHCFNRAPLKDLVLWGPLDGTTPLVLACHHGDLEMVMYLVGKWGVCVNDTGVYYPKGITEVRVGRFKERVQFSLHLTTVKSKLLSTSLGKERMLTLKQPLEGRHYAS